MIETLVNGTDEQQLSMMRRFRELISTKLERDLIIRTGLVPKFVEFVQRDEFYLQLEACWALINLTSGNSLQTKCVVEAGAVPVLVKLLSSPSENVQMEAVWCLGNIAGDDREFRDLVLDHGILAPLLQ